MLFVPGVILKTKKTMLVLLQRTGLHCWNTSKMVFPLEKCILGCIFSVVSPNRLVPEQEKVIKGAGFLLVKPERKSSGSFFKKKKPTQTVLNWVNSESMAQQRVRGSILWCDYIFHEWQNQKPVSIVLQEWSC